MKRVLAALTDGEQKIILLQDAVTSLVWSIERSDEWNEALSTPHGEMVGVFLDVDITLKVIGQATPEEWPTR